MKITRVLLVFIFCLIAWVQLEAQNVGISSVLITPDVSSMLEVRATNRGVLIPRVALTGVADAATIPTPATSLLVYCTGTGGLSPAGFYYNSGTAGAPVWKRFATGSGDAWQLLGNAGTTPATNFVGTSDAQDLVFRTSNTERMRIVSAGNVGVGTAVPNATSQVHIYKTGALAELLLQSNGHDSPTAGGRILFNNDVFGNAQGNITFVNDGFGSSYLNSGITYFGNAISINGDGPNAVRNSNLAVGTTLFVSDVESGTVIRKVGIGTTTPRNSLDVSNANGLGVAIGSYAGVNAASSGGMIISGNVGVGTATPAATNKMDIQYTTGAGGGKAENIVLTSNSAWPTFDYGVSSVLSRASAIGQCAAVLGQVTSVTANSGRNFGVQGYCSNGGVNVGVKGSVSTAAGNNTGVLGVVVGFDPAFNEATTMLGNWAGYFSGDVSIAGALQANGSVGTAGQVLTSNGAGAAYWAAAGGGGSLWTDAGVYNYSNNHTGIRAYDVGQQYGLYSDNSGGGANGTAVFGYMGSGAVGTGYGYAGSRASVRGYAYYGYDYTYGVAGYRYDDGYNRGGGVFGGSSQGNPPTAWGSLGYRSSATTHYGCYYTSVGTGAGFMQNEIQTGIGIGGYGGVMGSWSRGEILGSTSCGELYASYNIGNEYTSGYQADIVTVGDKRTAAYSVTSTDLKVYIDGKGKLISGKVRVNFDPSFIELIGDAIPTVTATPMGECNGVYIFDVDSKGFSIAELNHGTSDVEFSYIVIGRRLDDPLKTALPEALSDKEFDAKLKGVMFNESNTERNATPIWWDGTKIRFDKSPETEKSKEDPKK